VVEKRTVPKECVRLDTDTVTEERQAAEEVRREHIQVDGDQDQLPRQDQRYVESENGTATRTTSGPPCPHPTNPYARS
jgi:Domain of unknown function (DUF2382)